MAGADEAGGDGEANGAAAGAVDVVGITATDGGKSGGHLLDGDDLEFAGSKADLGSEALGVGDTGRESLDDELVGGDIDVVGSNTDRLGVRGQSLDLVNLDGVEGLLGLLELGQAVAHKDGSGASSLDLGGTGLVGDADVDSSAVAGNPGSSKVVASRALDVVNNSRGRQFAGDAGSGSLGVKAKVTLHGSQDLGVQLGSSLHRGTVGNGQDGSHDGEELGELHGG